MTKSVAFEDIGILSSICGVNDRNVEYLEELLNIELRVRGNLIECHSQTPEECELFSNLMDRLQSLSLITQDIGESEILLEYQSLNASMTTNLEKGKNIFIHFADKSIYPKSLNQKKYIWAMQNAQIVFGTGPAGTGKTYLAVANSLAQVLSGKRKKLVITRPVVEAGESLGFLPGDLTQKLNPYLKPLYDSIEAIIGPVGLKRMMDNGVIEIAPLAYMRGRSIHNACVILDEAQNTTRNQMKMFLTRLGENSQAVITGDCSQSDLPHKTVSGLNEACKILKGIKGIEFINFCSIDTVRSRIVQRIIEAYEKQ